MKGVRWLAVLMCVFAVAAIVAAFAYHDDEWFHVFMFASLLSGMMELVIRAD